MHTSTIVLLASVGAAVAETFTGSYTANMALKNLFERQTRLCTPVPAPATCERSCGPGFITCVSFPTCYNPGRGDTCCSNGKYCPKGYYCTDAGCCPVGTPLADCGATTTLSIILPGAPASTEAATVPSVTPTPSAPATSFSSEVATSTSIAAAETTVSTTVAAVESSTTVVGTIVVPPTSAGSNVSVTAISPPIQTAGAAQGVTALGAVQMVLGGMGVWAML